MTRRRRRWSLGRRAVGVVERRGGARGAVAAIRVVRLGARRTALAVPAALVGLGIGRITTLHFLFLRLLLELALDSPHFAHLPQRHWPSQGLALMADGDRQPVADGVGDLDPAHVVLAAE